ncbi:MAG: hypothetical protein ACYCSW_11250 [bacterium]
MENSNIGLIEKKVAEYIVIIDSIESEIERLYKENSNLFPVLDSAGIFLDKVGSGIETSNSIENTRRSFADKDMGAFNKHRDIASNALSAIEIAIEAATIAKAAFDGISNYFNERELKKENKLKLEQQKKELEQVKIKFKNIAKEKIDTVKEIHDFLLKSSSTLFITLKDSCSEIMPISESVRRRSHREGINKTYNNYFTILKLKTRVEFVISVFLNFINGSDDISGFKKVNDHDIRKSIYDEIYDFSDVDKLINDATSIVYYNNGICEGVLYCFSNKEIIKGNRKWRDALNKFKIIYSKEAFKTHSFFKQTNADKKRTQYNNVYLKDIPNIDSIYKQNVKRKKERIFISLGIATAVVLASLLIIFILQK